MNSIGSVHWLPLSSQCLTLSIGINGDIVVSFDLSLIDSPTASHAGVLTSDVRLLNRVDTASY